MSKASFLAFFLFLIEMIVTIIAEDKNTQNVSQNNENEASSNAGVENNNSQDGSIE